MGLEAPAGRRARDVTDSASSPNSASRARSSSVRPPRAAIRSGRRAWVRARDWARRQRATRPWSPERSTSGTDQPRNIGRPGVLRVLEQAVPEALVDGRLVVAHHPGDQPGDRLDDGDGRRLTAGQHEVAEGQLAVGQVVGDALVDALVAPAQQREPRRGRQLGRPGLVEAPAARAEQQQRPGRSDGLDGGEHGLGGQHHPGSPAEGAVVDRPVRIGGAGPEVVDPQVEQPGPGGLADQAGRRPGRHQIREKSEHIDAQAADPLRPVTARAGRAAGRRSTGRAGVR